MTKWKLIVAEKLLEWLLKLVEKQRSKTGKSDENVV